MTRRAIWLGVFILWCASACDTPGSFTSDEGKYFLKYYGLEDNQTGVDFVTNPDGTFVLLGNSRRIRKTDPQATDIKDWQIYVVKIDAKGKTIWEKTFGGLLDENAKDIELLTSGDLIIAGTSEKNVGDRDVYLLRLRQDGTPIDSSRQGLKNGAVELDEDVSTVTEVSQGLTNPAGFIVAGSTTGSKYSSNTNDVRDAMQMRFGPDLSKISGTWSDGPTFQGGGFEGEDAAVKVIQFDNNTYYVFGYTNAKTTGTTTTSDFDFWIYTLSDVGLLKSSSKFIGNNNFNEKLLSVTSSPIQSGAGAGYVLVGSVQNLAGTSSPDLYYAKVNKPIPFSNPFDNAGVFSKPIGLQNVSSNFSASCFVTTDNIFLTYSSGTTLTSNISVVKMDNNPQQVWNYEFGGTGDDVAGAVSRLSTDGGVVIIGTMTLGGGSIDGQTKMVFMKLNPSGRLAP